MKKRILCLLGGAGLLALAGCVWDPPDDTRLKVTNQTQDTLFYMFFDRDWVMETEVASVNYIGMFIARGDTSFEWNAMIPPGNTVSVKGSLNWKTDLDAAPDHKIWLFLFSKKTMERYSPAAILSEEKYLKYEFGMDDAEHDRWNIVVAD